jgi:hypothetical protein
MKALIAIALFVLAGAVRAQEAGSKHPDSPKAVQHTFASPDGNFQITYPDVLIRCERVREKNGASYSYFWKGPGCSAYIPPCSNADADDQPLLCLAYPPNKFASNPTFGAAVFTVGESNENEKECLSYDRPLKPMIIRGVTFTAGEDWDAALSHWRHSKGYGAYHNGKCYGFGITIVGTSGAIFDPPVKELTKDELDEVNRPLEQVRDSFEFLK